MYILDISDSNGKRTELAFNSFKEISDLFNFVFKKDIEVKNYNLGVQCTNESLNTSYEQLVSKFTHEQVNNNHLLEDGTLYAVYLTKNTIIIDDEYELTLSKNIGLDVTGDVISIKTVNGVKKAIHYPISISLEDSMCDVLVGNKIMK